MYKSILLPVDLTEESSWRKALPTAVACCRAFGAELHLLTVVPDFGSAAVAQYFPEDFEEKIITQTRDELRAFADRLVPEEVEVHLMVAYGTIYEKILEVAGDVHADLIVMAAHRPELKDYLLGPNAARVVRHADQSVLVVRE